MKYERRPPPKYTVDNRWPFAKYRVDNRPEASYVDDESRTVAIFRKEDFEHPRIRAEQLAEMLNRLDELEEG